MKTGPGTGLQGKNLMLEQIPETVMGVSTRSNRPRLYKTKKEISCAIKIKQSPVLLPLAISLHPHSILLSRQENL